MTSVLLVANHGALGGGEVMLLESARVLSSLGVNPVILAPDEPSDLLRKAQSYGMDTISHSSRPRGPFSGLRGLRRAVRAIRKIDPSALTWCHGLGAAVATTGQAGRVVHLHRVPDRSQLPLAWVSCLGAKDVVVPSQDTLARLPKIMQRRTHVLSNWTCAIPRRRDRTGQKARDINVGFLGRPAPGKGIGDLAQAISLLHRSSPTLNIRLKVAGEPHFVSQEDQDQVARSLARLGDRVEQIGWVERGKFLNEIDILVCPSRWPESFGLVVAEAMAVGVPVVVSDAGALPEVAGREHPYISSAGNVDDLARVLGLACSALGTPEGATTIEASYRRWFNRWSPEAGHQRVRQALIRWGIPR